MKTNEKIVRAVLKIVNPEAEALLTPAFIKKYKGCGGWEDRLMNLLHWASTPQRQDYWWEVHNSIAEYLQQHPDFNPDTPTGHPHAELMAQYAEIAKTNAKPWERFEYAYSHTKGYWNKLTTHPAWETNVNYRIIPAVSTCTLAGITFPKPVSEPLELHTEYWRVRVDEGDVRPSGWDDYTEERRWLQANLIQLTEEGAEQQLLAMQTALQQAVDNHV